jgi:hypothetical protein
MSLAMNYDEFSDALQPQLQAILPLSPAQLKRLVLLCRCIILSARLHLSFLARWLPMRIQQDSRIRWLRRLLSARFMRQDLVYQPLLQSILGRLKLKEWHLIIDRTNWLDHHVDLVTISALPSAFDPPHLATSPAWWCLDSRLCETC